MPVPASFGILFAPLCIFFRNNLTFQPSRRVLMIRGFSLLWALLLLLGSTLLFATEAQYAFTLQDVRQDSQGKRWALVEDSFGRAFWLKEGQKRTRPPVLLLRVNLPCEAQLQVGQLRTISLRKVGC